MSIRLSVPFVLLALSATAASAQRQTGVIGAYVPPRDWPQEPRRFDLLHQAIHVRFDVPHRELFGEVTSRVAVTQAPTDTVRFDAEHLTIDAARDGRGRALRYVADSTHVTVRFGRRLAPGDTVEFTLRYHGFPERGLYIVPRRHVVWSQGEATETRAWVPTYDAPNDKTTWEFFVTADSGMKVLSNGRLGGVTAERGSARSVWHWVQDKPASTYLYSVVVGPFTVLHDQWRGIPVEYYTYADTVASAWRSFGETPAMIELYSQVLGVPFAWDKYDQSIIPDFTYGGMENVSATTQTDLALLATGDQSDFAVRGLDAHELAHQWFGDLTTTATWAHIWLNEGITTYMESVQEEKTRGWDAAELNWYQEQQQAMGADRNELRPLVWGKYQGDDPIVLFFSGHVYPKGAQVAHQLRRLLGDSVFWAGMHRFLVDNAYKPVTTADYAVAMEKTCNCDLDWFFDQWAYGIGYPQVRFARHWAENLKTLHVIVTQTQPIDSTRPVFQFPATIRVITRDSVVRHQIMVRHQTDTFAIALPSAPLSFRFDEGGWLLGTVTGDLTEAELSQMAAHDLDIRARRWALAQLEASGDSLAAATRRLVLLNDHAAWLREVAARQMARDSSPDSRAVLAAALRDQAQDVRAQALRTLAGLDSTAGASLANAIYSSDPANTVRESALGVLAATRPAATVPLLVTATGTNQPRSLRATAVDLLGRIRDQRGGEALERVTVPGEDRNLRAQALDAILASGDSTRATTVAERYLGDPDPLFAGAAVQMLARAAGPSARAKLTQALSTEKRVTVRQAIQRALSGSGGR
jgi:aminopeptidase N